MHFVDTNLLVYARDSAVPEKRDRANQVMARLWKTGSGCLSHQVLIEFYSIVTRKLKPGLPRPEAVADIRALQLWTVVRPSSSLFEMAWHAEQRFDLSWWDSLIVAAAQLASCQTLLSEDLQNGMDLDGVRVVNPFEKAFNSESLS